MKFVFLTGGFAGFALGAGTAYWAGRGPDRVLLDGAVGCLAGGMLFRWFWTVLVRGIRETIVSRHAAVTAEAAAAEAKSK